MRQHATTEAGMCKHLLAQHIAYTLLARNQWHKQAGRQPNRASSKAKQAGRHARRSTRIRRHTDKLMAAAFHSSQPAEFAWLRSQPWQEFGHMATKRQLAALRHFNSSRSAQFTKPSSACEKNYASKIIAKNTQNTALFAVASQDTTCLATSSVELSKNC